MIMKKFFRKLFDYLISLLFVFPAKIFGYNVTYTVLPLNYRPPHLKFNYPGTINLNIGSGSYVIEGFKSLDILSENYYPDESVFHDERIKYDIRKDTIPFGNETVDNIYISHVIEHIETQHVKKFLTESLRVLKPKGVLRIATPDAKFLYYVSQFENDYWTWRHGSMWNDKFYTTNWDIIEQYDFFVRETSSPRSRFYKYKIDNKVFDIQDIKHLSFEEYRELATKDLEYREDRSSDHINIWDFERLNELGTSIGFSKVFESKHKGSVSKVMQNNEIDRTAPQMSLYVEMIK